MSVSPSNAAGPSAGAHPKTLGRRKRRKERRDIHHRRQISVSQHRKGRLRDHKLVQRCKVATFVSPLVVA